MAGRVEEHRGGILGLRRLLADRKTAEAIQADLLCRGRSLVDLGTWALSYWDLLCIIRWLPAKSALYRHLHPDSWQWNLLEHLLAGIYDTLQGGNWQRAGNPDAPRPTPLPRPGIGEEEKPKKVQRKTIPLDEIHAEFARRRAEAQHAAVPAPPELPSRPTKNRRLSANDVRIVRRMGAAGAPVDDIANGLHITPESVERILAGKTYRNVPDVG